MALMEMYFIRSMESRLRLMFKRSTSFSGRAIDVGAFVAITVFLRTEKSEPVARIYTGSYYNREFTNTISGGFGVVITVSYFPLFWSRPMIETKKFFSIRSLHNGYRVLGPAFKLPAGNKQRRWYVVVKTPAGLIDVIPVSQLVPIPATTTRKQNPKIYAVWRSLLCRCLRPWDRAFAYYGGRGVTVCEEWLTFDNFLWWMLSQNYAPGLTVDRRINTSPLGYHPLNCRLTTRAEQNRNRGPFRKRKTKAA